MMRRIFKYFILICASIVAFSCLKEEFTPPYAANSDTVEFIVRPTSFSGYDVSSKRTKSLTGVQLSEVERKIASAYFIVFDGNGNRVVFESLEVNNNTIPTQKLLTDYGGNNDVTVCFLANVTPGYASSLLTVGDLSTKPFPITYAPYEDTGYIGIPSVDVKNTPENLSDDELCFPMLGVKTCSLHSLTNNKVIIELKRLFAKISVSVNLDWKDAGVVAERDPRFELKKYTIKNLPTKVRLAESKSKVDDQIIISENDWISDSTAFIADIPVNTDITIENDTISTNGHNIHFYVPEYALLPDPVKLQEAEESLPEERERMKPLLVADGTCPISIEIKGMYFSPENDDIDMTYSIFLGENNFDSFSTFRNILYVNNMTIRGAALVDNRVEMKYAGFQVGFPHSVQMDAHYNVRPLRLRFTEEFTEGLEKGLYTHGEIKIEIRKGAGSDTTSWIALERPIVSEIDGNDIYSQGYMIGDKSAPYPTKRRYFTTNLITELNTQQRDGLDDPAAGESVTFRTDEGHALDGTIITWVYVDEYNTQSTTSSREDTLAVTFTMDGSSEGVTKKYLVRQSAIFPLTNSERTYGIELFEEYTMNYDSDEYYDADTTNVGFHTDYNGIAWGLDSVYLSQNNPAIYLSNTQFGVSDNTDERLKNYFLTGIFDLNLINTIIAPQVEEKIDADIQKLESYYDFYTEDDEKFVGDIAWNSTRDYDGFKMNLEIIYTLLKKYKNKKECKLNGMIIDETPLSTIAYCYNKNKRNANGDVISENSDGSLNITNYHWYAPAVEEIKEIIEVGYNNGNLLHEEFETFDDEMYWSCQPAYLNNDLEVHYVANTEYKIENTRHKQEISLKGALVAYTTGNFLQDDIARARASRYDREENKAIESYSAHTSYIQTTSSVFTPDPHTYTTSFSAWLTSAEDVANSLISYPLYTARYFYSLREYLESADWSTELVSSGETPNRGEGNLERRETNRVRCVYYNHNFTTATRKKVSGLDSWLGKSGYEMSLR